MTRPNTNARGTSNETDISYDGSQSSSACVHKGDRLTSRDQPEPMGGSVAPPFRIFVDNEDEVPCQKISPQNTNKISNLLLSAVGLRRGWRMG